LILFTITAKPADTPRKPGLTGLSP